MKSKIRYSDFLAGLFCAFIGSALFAIVEIVRIWIEDPSSPDLFSMIPSIFLILFLGFMFSCIPAGIGGVVLGLILQNQMRKGTLTLIKATKIGILLAGIAVIITCVLGILVLLLVPQGHIKSNNYLDDLRQGKFFENFSSYLLYAIRLISPLGPEILTAITITCIVGGWAGRVLAKQLLFAKN